VLCLFCLLTLLSCAANRSHAPCCYQKGTWQRGLRRTTHQRYKDKGSTRQHQHHDILMLTPHEPCVAPHLVSCLSCIFQKISDGHGTHFCCTANAYCTAVYFPSPSFWPLSPQLAIVLAGPLIERQNQCALHLLLQFFCPSSPPPKQELAVARSGQTPDPSAGRMELAGKVENDAGCKYIIFTRVSGLVHCAYSCKSTLVQDKQDTTRRPVT
jgi:hypothetical protein